MPICVLSQRLEISVTLSISIVGLEFLPLLEAHFFVHRGKQYYGTGNFFPSNYVIIRLPLPAYIFVRFPRTCGDSLGGLLSSSKSGLGSTASPAICMSTIKKQQSKEE
jgi:hypothetical protein